MIISSHLLLEPRSRFESLLKLEKGAVPENEVRYAHYIVIPSGALISPPGIALYAFTDWTYMNEPE